ncbi:MAG: succinate dehydrogenase assembly factor 2 [Sphingobacteriia bacterium]|nr:succinate dehydrogenase assembly factor 2 [Sphingobacteriia bacterium]
MNRDIFEDKVLFLKRLHYLSVHRGSKESDFVLTKFANTELPHLNDSELKIYYDFLNEDDNDIMNWVMKKITYPMQYNFIMQKIYSLLDL